MKTRFWSVIWFASAGTAIGYSMREGYGRFAEADAPWNVIGLLAVAMTTGCAVVGMMSISRTVLKLPTAPRTRQTAETRTT